MHITATLRGPLRLQPKAGEETPAARLDREMARVQALSDDALEAMITLIDARNPLDVARKLHRFVVALASPGPILGRAFERAPDTVPGFCLSLVAYRAYMDRLAHGATPRQAANEVERGRRTWLARALREHSIPPWPPARHPHVEPGDEEDDEDDIDVYDAEGEIDPGAIRAEVDRLLRRLQVDPERVELTVLPDDGLGNPDVED